MVQNNSFVSTVVGLSSLNQKIPGDSNQIRGLLAKSDIPGISDFLDTVTEAFLALAAMCLL